jgi:DNA-binding protein H-NS
LRLPNLAKMTLDDLSSLRDDIDAHLDEMRNDLAKQLARLAGYGAGTGARRGRGSSLKGRKVPPKYRKPKDHSQTWAGRGATPRA